MHDASIYVKKKASSSNKIDYNTIIIKINQIKRKKKQWRSAVRPLWPAALDVHTT